MVKANTKSPPSFFTRLRGISAAFVCLLFSGMVLACVTPDGAASPGTALPSRRPMDMDPKTAEAIGREALAKIGYLPLLNLARQAGWVRTKEVRRPLGGDRSLISINVAQIAGASEFIDVYTEYAVAAGVTSQLDSPFPGPFDVAAVGILVLGLIDVALLKGALLETIHDVLKPTTSTTKSPPPDPKPESDPEPEGDPKPEGSTGPWPPVPPPPPPEPKEEKETCGDTMPKFIRCDDPRISHYRFRSEDAVFKAIVSRLGKGLRKSAAEDGAQRGPCVKLGGFHTNVLRGGGSVASIVGCNCCDDSSGKAIRKQRADVELKR